MSLIVQAEDTPAAAGTAVRMFPALLLHRLDMGSRANITLLRSPAHREDQINKAHAPASLQLPSLMKIFSLQFLNPLSSRKWTPFATFSSQKGVWPGGFSSPHSAPGIGNDLPRQQVWTLSSWGLRGDAGAGVSPAARSRSLAEAAQRTGPLRVPCF